MLLKSERYDRINIKIAPCLKFPYACKTINEFSENESLGSYSDIYGTILFKEVSCGKLSYRTYFRTKNDALLYYNHAFADIAWYNRYERDKYKLFWFMLDVVNDTYLPIEIPKLNYITAKDKSLLVKLKDRFYVLSRELYPKESLNDIGTPIYVAIIDANSGHALFLENRKSNLHLDLYYPIANKIVPIIQFNKNGVFVHLLDILDNKISIISWTIDEIKQIMIDIINKDIYFKSVRKKVAQDVIEQISTAKVSHVNYIYDANEEHIKRHIKGFKIYFEISIKGARYEYKLQTCGIAIVLEQGSIRCYLDLEHTRFELNNEKMSLYKNHYKETTILIQEFSVSTEIPEIYLPNVLYSNRCYDIIYNTTKGIAITKEKIDIIWKHKHSVIYDDNQFTISAIYQHKNYLFIIKFPTDKEQSYLVVIDLKSNTLYPFISKGDFRVLLSQNPKRRLEYITHQFKLSNKIIFMSRDLRHVFAIKLNELNEKLRMIKQDDCKEEHYGYIEDFVEIFEMEQLLGNAILKTYKTEIEDDKIGALSYYIHRHLGKLYIIATYDIDNTKCIGAFELISSAESTFLRLIAYYPYERALYYKNKSPINLPSISNSVIQKIYSTNTFNNNLEIVCNINSMFFDIGNNRTSVCTISKDFSIEEVRCENFGEYLEVELKYNRRRGVGVTIVQRDIFIISRLNVVSKMPILSL